MDLELNGKVAIVGKQFTHAAYPLDAGSAID